MADPAADELAEEVARLRAEAERLRARLRAVEQQATRLADFFERTPIPMVRTDRTGRIRATNDAFARLVGRRRRKLEGTSLFDLVHPDDLQASTMRHALLLGGDLDHFHEDVRYVSAKGATLWTRGSMYAERDADDVHRGTIGLVRDVSDAHEAREQLGQVRADLDAVLRAASERGAGAVDLDEVVRAAAAEHPGIAVELEELGTATVDAELLRYVLARQLQLAGPGARALRGQRTDEGVNVVVVAEPVRAGEDLARVQALAALLGAELGWTAEGLALRV